MKTKYRLITITFIYQMIVLALYGAGIMGDFFDLFGSDWNTLPWRRPVATVAAWFIMSIPLLAFIGYKLFRLREPETA